MLGGEQCAQCLLFNPHKSLSSKYDYFLFQREAYTDSRLPTGLRASAVWTLSPPLLGLWAQGLAFGPTGSGSRPERGARPMTLPAAGDLQELRVPAD